MYRPKPSDNWIPRITDMVTYAEECLSFVTVSSAEELARDVQSYSAVCFNLRAIDIAANGVPSEIRDRYPNIEWRNVMSPGNPATHEYDSIKPALVWNTVQNDLPKLLDQLKDLLQEEGADSTTPPPQT